MRFFFYVIFAVLIKFVGRRGMTDLETLTMARIRMSSIGRLILNTCNLGTVVSPRIDALMLQTFIR